ncbi:MAG: beta-lactamase family protein, partial [Deinococcota bacterium]|nr:beta-lactamase family protein [Deinococcota bacterium]
MTNHSTLARSSPELQGVSSSAISGFLAAIDREGLEVHSVMLLRHGHVVAEGWWAPYSSARVHLLYSLSKSFTATAIGLAVAEGLLSVDDPVLSFFPDEAPEKASEYLAGMRVRHLLSMATGHLTDTLDRLVEHGGGNWIKGFLALPPERAPGTVFTYNNGATFMLSAILEKLAGTKLLDYLRPRLLEPLGVTEAYWHENPQGITLGFTGLHLTTEAVARFGQLYLQRGRWQGRHLVPEWWVAEATTLQVPTAPPPEDNVTDWAQGYGYQFWRCQHGAYRGDGAFGQFCVVMPEQDAVLVITAAV